MHIKVTRSRGNRHHTHDIACLVFLLLLLLGSIPCVCLIRRLSIYAVCGGGGGAKTQDFLLLSQKGEKRRTSLLRLDLIKRTEVLTCAAARRQAGVSQTLGASWALVRGHRAARTTIMMKRSRMIRRRTTRMRRPREVTPKRPPAF